MLSVSFLLLIVAGMACFVPPRIQVSKRSSPPRINAGALRVGDQLPTEGTLIARFQVSRITIRRAIQNLVSRALVEIQRGKGTFVAAPKITQELTDLSGFVEDMHALDRKPTARVIGREIVTADAIVACQLALKKGERVVRIRRVRLADGVTVVLNVGPCRLPFVPHLCRVRQHGSNSGSITGPISVASGYFPFSNVLIGFAKLFRLRHF